MFVNLFYSSSNKIRPVIKNFLVSIILISVFYLLLRELLINWGKIKQYNFIFNYWDLLISYLIFLGSSVLFAQSWYYILKYLEPSSQITKYETFKVAMYARLGKYLPGKVWSFAGRIYMGSHYNVSKKTLLISSLLQVTISVISGIILGVLIITLLLNSDHNFFYLLIFPFFGLIVLFNPQFFYKILNFIIKKIGREPIKEKYHLNKKQLLFLYLQILLFQVLNGIAIFFLIRSFVGAPWNIWLDIVGIAVFSNTSGVLAVFSPGGIGVREGILAVFLKFYYPVSLAVLISLLARVWLIIGEGMIVIIISVFDKTTDYITQYKQIKNTY